MGEKKTLTLPVFGEVVASFECESHNPYNDEPASVYTFEHPTIKGWTMETFVDKKGKAFYAGASVRNGNTTPPVNAERLPVAVLRDMASKVISEAFPSFPQRVRSFHPLEDHLKRNLYFFRWDDFSTKVGSDEMPPFVQASITADGKVASFTIAMDNERESTIETETVVIRLRRHSEGGIEYDIFLDPSEEAMDGLEDEDSTDGGLCIDEESVKRGDEYTAKDYTDALEMAVEQTERLLKK